MSFVLKWLLRLVTALLLVALLALVLAALLPLPADPPLDTDHSGAGASGEVSSLTGLQRQFPPLNTPANVPDSAEQVALGRLLFFDPILSQNDDLACASCHHPDLGFADGQPRATSAQGQRLARHTPSLWNVGYARLLFWDGRATALEEQAELHLTHPDEMGVRNTGLLVAELRAIPTYVTLFDAAFGGGVAAITFDNVRRSLAAFERSLISDNSPFDRYAAGDFGALTPSQRRGLTLFRSGATRCSECHPAPTFASDTLRVIGVPGTDRGEEESKPGGLHGGFKVPTLRNVGLSAPYMHNGSLASLEDVVDFYAKGGGRAHGFDNVDSFVEGFAATEQERADLIAFLLALTDESGRPEVPASVPSGLPVVAPRANPGREAAAAANVGAGGRGAGVQRAPITIRLQPGESVQSAVDRARPGDTVEVPPGLYHERVAVDMSDLTLLGLADEQGEYPVLDGRQTLSQAIVASGNNFTIGRFQLQNYTDNGVLVEGATGARIHDIIAENTGAYGVYLLQSSDVLVERVEVTAAADAGIYAGQSMNVVIRDSVAYGNVLGIELENTLNGEVYGNHVYDNSLGILLVLLPHLTSKISAATTVYNNVVEGNNRLNFAKSGSLASLVPVGAGILLLGSDNNTIFANTIRDNNSAGLAILSLTASGQFEKDEIDVGPLPEDNWVHDNRYSRNGRQPAPALADLGLAAADMLWDGSGRNNRFDEAAASSFPPLLPGDNWPPLARRAYGNLFRWLAQLAEWQQRPEKA